MSRLLCHFFITLAIRGVLLCQVTTNEREMVRQLESPELREAFLARLSPQDKGTERLLLAILDSSRGQSKASFGNHELHVGMADAFGILGTKEAIPWLLTNLLLWRHNSSRDIKRWIRPSETIEYTFPAVRALARIGPSALGALQQAYYYEARTYETELAIVFTVSRMKDPSVKPFLESVQVDINNLQRFIKEALAAPESVEDVKK